MSQNLPRLAAPAAARAHGIATHTPPGMGGYAPPAGSFPPANGPIPPTPGAAPGALDPALMRRALRRYWWIVTLMAGGAAAWSYNYARHLPVSFRAKAVVQLQDRRQAMAGRLSAVEAEAANALLGSMASQTEILRSRSVAEEVVRISPLGTRVLAEGMSLSTLHKVTVPDSAPELRIAVAFSPSTFRVTAPVRGEALPYGTVTEVEGVRFTFDTRPSAPNGALVVLPFARAVDRTTGMVRGEVRKQTNLIDLSVTSAESKTARELVNAFALAYQRLNLRSAQQQSRLRRQFVEDQLQRTDAQLAEAERALSSFRNRQQTYSAADKFTAQQAGLRDLEARQRDLEAERRLASRLLTALERGDTTARREALRTVAAPTALGGNPLVTNLQQRIATYESQRDELVSGPSGRSATNPEVQRLDALVAGAQRELAAAVRSHISLIEARLELLTESRSQMASGFQNLPAAEVEESRLVQNAFVLREQAALLRAEYQQARISEAVEVGQVEILDLATGSSAIRASGSRVVIFAVFLGIVGGLAVAMLLEWCDKSIRRRDQLELELRIPVLATIPPIAPVASTVKGNRLFTKLRPSRAEMALAPKERPTVLTTAHHARSSGAEAYRRLRRGVFNAIADADRKRIIVTSASPEEGKTTVACNLAVAVATQGWRVLLIDCDLYLSRVHQLFELPQSPGLGEILTRDLEPRSAIRATSVDRLFVLTAGTSPDNPGEALDSARMRAVLADLGSEFDVVVIDSAPTLAVSDAAALSAAAEGVLLVARAGKTTTVDVTEALRYLDGMGAPVIGAVLNDPDECVEKQHSTAYYAASYGGYGYADR